MKNFWKDEMYQLAPQFKPKHFRFLKGFSCHNILNEEVKLVASTSKCAPSKKKKEKEKKYPALDEWILRSTYILSSQMLKSL